MIVRHPRRCLTVIVLYRRQQGSLGEVQICYGGLGEAPVNQTRDRRVRNGQPSRASHRWVDSGRFSLRCPSVLHHRCVQFHISPRIHPEHLHWISLSKLFPGPARISSSNCTWTRRRCNGVCGLASKESRSICSQRSRSASDSAPATSHSHILGSSTYCLI